MKKFSFLSILKNVLVLICLSTVTMATAQTARMQFINNSPDVTIDSVDLWLDSIKYVSSLPFRRASAVFTIPADSHIVSIKLKHSVASSSSLLQLSKAPFDSNITYLGILSGVIDTTKYGSNPDGINNSLTFTSTNSFSESAPASQFGYVFFNGVPDAPTFDFNQLTTPKTKLADNSAYNNLSSFIYANTSTALTTLSITNQDSSKFYGVHTFNFGATLATKTGVIFTSGVMDTVGYKANAPLMKVYIAYNNGTVSEITKLTSKLQFINNCPDSAIDAVDVYINGELKFAGLGFRKATTFMSVNASVPYAIAVAPKNSTNISQAIFTSSQVLTSGIGYYKVISGLKTPSNFPANPNGASTAFTVYTQTGARDTSNIVVNGNHPNVDLMYHHGSPDLMKTTMLTNNTVMFISKNDAYGTFHSPYAYQAPLDNLEFDLTDAATDTILLKKSVANIGSRIGQAGLIFTSGFYSNLVKRDTLLFPKDPINQNKKLTPNQLTRVLGLFIAWPDGIIDTIQPAVVITTGINTISSANQFHTTFYPNPASELLNISFEVQSESTVFAELFDINGRKISSTNELTKTNGRNQIEMDMRDVQNGIYFCTLSINGQKIVKKISIMK